MPSSRATPAFVAATAMATALLVGAVVLAAMAGSPRSGAESPAAVGPAVIVLDRGAETDRVMRVPLDPASPVVVVHEATGIRAVAVTGDEVLVARDGALELVGDDGAVESVELPEGAEVVAVVGASGSDLAAAMISGDDGADEILVIDHHDVVEVTSLVDESGDPIPAQRAWVASDGTMLVHHADARLLRRSTDGAFEEVGSYSAVHGISSDGRSAFVADDDGGLIIDLASGDVRRIPAPVVADRESFPGEASSIDGRTIVQRVAVPSESFDSFAVMLLADDGERSRILARTVDDAGALGRFAISPDGAHVAVEVTPVVADAVSDGRAVDPQPTSVTLAIIEIGTGALVRTVEGFAPSWMRGL